MNINTIHSCAAWLFNPYICWIMVFSALLGAYYNATLRFKLSYVIWVTSNLYLMIHNFRIHESAQATMYVVYLVINIIGLKNTIGNKGWLTPKK
jgi:hypothetical protein